MNNIVIGDSGYIDWTARDAGRVYVGQPFAPAGSLSGDDTVATDIDRIQSTHDDDGGNDVIQTGQGDDIIIGGEDSEIVVDVAIAGVVTTAQTVTADLNVNGVAR